jgi:Na+/alanine symporter
MALPNLIGLLLLSGVAARETRLYFERQASGIGRP